MENIKKIILPIIAIVLIGLIWFFVFKKGGNKEEEIVAVNTPYTLEQKFDLDKLPTGLPQDIPVEMSEPPIKNGLFYFKRTEEIHSTRIYYSKKTLEENLSIFEKYLKNNKWNILSKIDNPTSKYLLAQKNKNEGVLIININKDSISGKVVVEVSKIDKNIIDTSN